MVEPLSDPADVVGVIKPAFWLIVGVAGGPSMLHQASQQGASSDNDGIDNAGIEGGSVGGTEAGGNNAGNDDGRDGGKEVSNGESTVGGNGGSIIGAGDADQNGGKDAGDGCGNDAHNDTFTGDVGIHCIDGSIGGGHNALNECVREGCCVGGGGGPLVKAVACGL